MSNVYVWWILLLQPQLFIKYLPPSYIPVDIAQWRILYLMVVLHPCTGCTSGAVYVWPSCSWNLKSLFGNLRNREPPNNTVVLIGSAIATAVWVSNVRADSLIRLTWVHLKFSVGLGSPYFMTCRFMFFSAFMVVLYKGDLHFSIDESSTWTFEVRFSCK